MPSLLGGAGFTGCDALDQAGVNRIPGLNALLPLEANGMNAAFGYIGSAIVLLGLAWVVILAIRRYLKAPKD